mgnify:CR=1 FL=1|tara:strand:- start:6234 stop:6632 length:399 start_codon:yes stop_codon:yes gene_type:complete
MNINLIRHEDAEQAIDHENVLIDNINNIPTAGCQSLIMNDILNYISNEQLQTLIQGKMRHGGTIVISSVDAIRLTSAFYRNEINIEVFSSLVKETTSQHTLTELQSLFQNNGYVIESAGTNALSLFLKVKRP